jgi:LysM repeat protein
MNDKFTNNTNSDDENIARKLNQLAEQINVNAQFAAELEEVLRNMHRPKARLFGDSSKQVSPTLRWAALMILLALVLSWSIKTLSRAPQPAVNNTASRPDVSTPTPDAISETATPVSEEGGYDWRGAKLYLEQPLPESPDKAHIYLLKKDEPATEDQARAIADRFGIQGEMYTAPGLIYGTTNYAISDGKQLLQVHSDRYFTYTSNIAKNNRNSNGTPNDNAETIISEFLQARGFDFSFSVSAAGALGGYIVQPLAPDLIPMQYESFTQPVMRVTLDENGDILSMNASLMDYDPTPTGDYGIITPQEALQILLDVNILAGKMEFFHSPGKQSQDWYRDYPDNQAVTIHGNVTSNPSTDPNKPALVLIDGIPAVGNTNGMEKLDYYTFVEATGQYNIEGEIRKFNVESWNTNVESSYILGTLHREGDQIILKTDDGSGNQYPILNPPNDVPLDTKLYESQLSVQGVIIDGKLDWQYISYYADVNQSGGGGGGGGGGGLGFYQLNLSGTPVPFPSSTAQPQTNPGTITYVVQENDTLASIALNFEISVDELMQANGITENLVITGQTLIIPNAQPESNQGNIEYIVKEGDTVFAIAETYGITPEKIFQANNLSDGDVLNIGMKLVIPTQESVEEKVEDLRGFLSITTHKKTDGTEAREYSLTVDTVLFYPLEGSNLSELDTYNGLPILVSGTIRTANGMVTLIVENHKIPFPDLQFQIVRGTQKSKQLDGQTVVVFTTEHGKSYVELMASTDRLSNSFTGLQGDLIQQEVLIIPDEIFGGMPVVRVYQSSIIQENAPEMQVQANQIYIFDETDIPDMPTDYTPPNLTIKKVELLYFVSNPYYQINDPNYSQRSPHIQPVWHFHGQYDVGSEFDILIQALKQEFLLPELAPGLSPG